MQLQQISLINFKNYHQADLSFSPKINCFVGNNGVGKTNLLDAFYYLSFCKSHFNSIDSQNIKKGQDFFVIHGTYKRNESDEDIYCGLKKGQKKQFKRNKKEYSRLADHIGFIPLVMKSPADTDFIYSGSDERRKFIDSVISQFDKDYLNDLLKYNRTLSQRNKLLKDSFKRNINHEDISIYDEQLHVYGTRIYNKRKQFTSDILPIFRKFYEQISIGNEKVELEYVSQLSGQSLNQLLSDSVEKDKILQYTTKGIHKDDLIMSLQKQSLKKFGSQGQQKTFLIALKFAQYDYITKETGLKPILLLDDIFDKLDRERVQQIIKLVTKNHFGQIFITDTSHDRLKEILSGSEIEHKIFFIDKDANIELAIN